MPLPPPGRPTASDHQARLLLGLVGDDVKKAGAAEVNARLAEARKLAAQANDPSIDPSLRQAAKMRAQAVLTAKVTASRWNPAAVVAKARADRQPLACCDARGRIWGVCSPDDVSPVVAGRIRVRKNAGMAVYDGSGRLLGTVDPGAVTRVITTAAEARKAIAKARKASGKARKTGAEVRGRYERKASGKPRPGDRDGDDAGWGTNSAAPEVQARQGTVDTGGTTAMGGQAGAWTAPQPGRTVLKGRKR